MMPLVSFRPKNFDKATYDGLPQLDQMRYDINCIYAMLYKEYSQPFRGCFLFEKLLPPQSNPLTMMNRQVSITNMEYVMQGIYMLYATHLEIFADPYFDSRDGRERREAAENSLCAFSDVLCAEASLFLSPIYGPRLKISLQNLASRTSYYPENREDASFDLQAGLASLYKYVIRMRILIPTPIMISYRNDGVGKGALFDHVTMQRITQRDTVIVVENGRKLLIRDVLGNNPPATLEFGISENNYTRPLYLGDLSLTQQEEGLLVIPGRAEMAPEKIKPHVQEDNERRATFEKTLIKQMLNKRPILFICGGLYRLCEVFDHPIVSVQNHQGSMPSLINNQVVGNAPAHKVLIDPQSKTAKLLGFSQASTLAVTSVHHCAAQEPLTSPLQQYFVVAGRAESSSHGKGGKSIEVLENKGDGPTAIAVQFHPESALGDSPDENKQKQMIRALANEADDRKNKNLLNTEAHVMGAPYNIIEEFANRVCSDNKPLPVEPVVYKHPLNSSKQDKKESEQAELNFPADLNLHSQKIARK